MPPPMCCTCTRCAGDSTRCWRARGAASWRVPASISCRHAHCLILRAGRSKTSSRISANFAGGRVLGDNAVAVSTKHGLTSIAGGRPESGLARDIAVARRVIRADIDGLEQLAQTLESSFGDALAIALLERKGFSTEDFRMFHPGGRLGRKLLRVRDIMHGGDTVPLIDPDAPMSEALLIMTAKSFGCVGVCGPDGRLVGVITDGDLRRHMDEDLLSRRVSEIMHPNPKTTTPGSFAAEALGLMNRFAITAPFVVDDGQCPTGFLH